MAKKKRDWRAQRDRDRARAEAEGIDYDAKTAAWRNASLKRRALREWTPTVEARAIELLNQKLPLADVNKILESEGLVNFPGMGKGKSGKSKYDYRGFKLIYQDLLNDGKLDPSITELITSPGTKRLQSVKLAQQKKILQHYLESPETFKGKPSSILSKSFNARYGLTKGTNQKKGTGISPGSAKKAIEDAIAGKHPEFDEHFKGFQISDFIKGRHENIFPDVQKLDRLIKEGMQEGYIMDPNMTPQDKMRKLKANYAAAVGKKVTDPKIENEFLSRMRKILNRYIGGEEERYNKDLYNTIEAPVQNYKDHLLKPNLIAITQMAGQMSNSHIAEALGLPAKDVKLLKQLQYGTAKLGEKYGLPKNPRSQQVAMAGDHTDMKSLMKDFPEYEKNFMRIAYISEGLNTLKAKYDKKILSLYRKALQGHTHDKGPPNTAYMDVAIDKATGKEAELRGKPFDPKKHKWQKKKYVHYGYQTPLSGPLAKGQDYLTIPEAIKKIQNEFSELSGGYKIGGFKIDKPRVMGPDNITLQKFISPRINERSSPFAMTIRETLGNLQYGEPGGKRIPNAMLNIVDRALIGPEGATTKGRMDIIKKFGPEDLQGSGYLAALRSSGLPKGESAKITAILNKGFNEAIKAADVNENDICSLIGMKRGGLAGGGCGEQMRKALQEAPDETVAKIAQGPNNRARTFARQILNKIPKGGRLGAILAGAGAVGAGTWAMMGGAEADTMKYNATTGQFDDAEGEPETQEGILNWIADNPIKSGLAPIPIGMGAGLGAEAMNAPNIAKFFTSMKFMLPPAYAAEKLYQYKEGQDLGEMFTNPLDAVWAMALDTKASRAAKWDYYKNIAQKRVGIGPLAKGAVEAEQLGFKPSTWKNIGRATMAPASRGTRLVFPFATEKYGFGKPITEGWRALAPSGIKRGLGMAARLAPLGPIPMALVAGSMAWDKYKFNQKVGDHVDALRAQGVVSEEDAETMETIYKQGWLGTTALGAKLLGSEELMFEGEMRDLDYQKMMLDQMKEFYEGREEKATDLRAGERQEDFFSWFSKGGRVGVAEGGDDFKPKGGMTRRTFLKWLVGSIAAGVAAVTGKGVKQAAKPVVKEAVKAVPAKFAGVEGMPGWFPRAVEMIKAKGVLKEMADRDYVGGDVYEITLRREAMSGPKDSPFRAGWDRDYKVRMEENPLTGEINLSWYVDDFDGEMIREINFKPGSAGYQKFGVDPEHPQAWEYQRVKVEEPEFSYTQPNQADPERADLDYLDIFKEPDDTVGALENLAGPSAKELESGVVRVKAEAEQPIDIIESTAQVSKEGNYEVKETLKETDTIKKFKQKLYKDLPEDDALVPDPEGQLGPEGDWLGDPPNEMIEGDVPDWVPKDEWPKKAEGGIIETGNIARRPGAVPPLSGPDPEGIMTLYSNPKQVKVG